MGKNKQQVPRLRFPGFNDAWEQRKLGKLVNIVGGGTPDTTNPEYWNGDIDWYSPTEIGTKVYANGSVKKITALGLEKSSAKILPANSTILFTSRAGIGDMAILKKQGATNQGFQSFVVGNGVNVYFLYSMGRQIKDFAIKNASGSTFLEISKNQLAKMNVIIPNEKEQTAIGNFFKQLDAAIASHQRKLERTNKLKKSLLQKMFPKDGEAFPELRFPDFTDAWEQRKLNEISQKVTEKNVNNIYQETFTNSAEFGIINQRDFFDKDISNKANLAGYYVVQNNDFVYNPRISNFAPVGPIKRNKLGRNGVMSPLYYVFRVDSVDYQFLETYFENTQWHIFMKENGDNGARSDRFAIKDSVFSTMPILLPSQQEQTAIGNFFRQLDEAIASHQRKLEHMQTLKKGLLQQMFV